MLKGSSQHSLEGILLVDKPKGCTSHDIVDRVRRKLRMKRIGHAGTLDPMATGLLIILVGRATKASQYLMSLSKEYTGKILLGQETDSYDAEGELTERKEVPELDKNSIEELLKEFSGDQYQTPPMYSAKKVEGVPLYKLARKGKIVERKPRLIHIYHYKLINFESPTVEFCVKCSKGTYIRTLAHDLGQKIGCGAHLIELRRTEIEDFSLEEAKPIDDIENMSITEIKNLLIPVHKAVKNPLVQNGS